MHSILCDSQSSIESFIQYIYEVSIQFNTDKQNIIKHFLNYIVRKLPNDCTTNFLETAEFVVHAMSDAEIDDVLHFLFHHLVYNKS
jgi:pantothenate kinase